MNFLYIFICIVRRAVNHFLLVFCVMRYFQTEFTVDIMMLRSDCLTKTRTMNNLPQQGLARMETIVGGEWLKHFMKTGRALQAIACPACSDVPVRLLQLSPEDGNLTGLHTVTLNSL